MAIITGTDANDVLGGTGETDEIRGAGGNDTIIDAFGGGGDDRLYGEDGNDLLRIERTPFSSAPIAVVVLDGGSGNDRLELQAIYETRLISATVTGGTGDDVFDIRGYVSAVIDAGDGDDVIGLVITGGQPALVTLGSGRDTVTVADYYSGVPVENDWQFTVTDFVAGNSGDIIDLSGWLGERLIAWDGYNPFGLGYLRLQQSGADTLVQVDLDGVAGEYGWKTLFTLSNVAAAALTGANFAGLGPDGSPAVGIVINGGPGTDYLDGTIGGDTIYGNGGGDYLYGYAGNDTLYLGADGGFADGGTQDDTIYGGAGDDDLLSGAGNDTVFGGGGNDGFLDQDGGNDVFHGDEGDDYFSFIRLGTTGNVVANGGIGDDQFAADGANAGLITLNGDAGDDRFTLTGSTGVFAIAFGSGADALTIRSSFNRDAQIGWDGTAFLPTVTIADITASDRIDFADVLEYGLTGWDGVSNPLATGHLRLLQDGPNVRLQIDVDGGANGFVDFITYQNVVVASLTAANLGGLPGNGGTPPGLTLTGTNDFDRLFGSSGADTILLLDGNDYAEGGAGNDIIEGGGGYNTLWGGTGNDRLVGTGFGDALYGDAGDDVLIGGASFATLRGGSGNDSLDATVTSFRADLAGGLGFDTVLGGAGDDDITIEDADDVDGGGGEDFAYFDLRASLVGMVVDLRPLWSGGVGIVGTGQIRNVEIVQTIRGSSKGDVINLAGYGDQVTIYAGGGDDYAEGGEAADYIDGGGNNDQLVGNGGNDVLDGFFGNDTLVGGDGNDDLEGGAGSDVLIGGAGDDLLNAIERDGAVGVVEQLYGGSGDDIYFVDGSSDVVFETAGGGVDGVYSDSGYYLWDNIEGLFLNELEDGRSNDFFGVGNALDNRLEGNTGNNLLIGGAGNDLMNGYTGNDQLFGEAGDDDLSGGEGIDYIVGGAGNDTIDGETGADALYGGDGDDTLDAGYGFVTDILVGGAGNDLLIGRYGNDRAGDYDLMDGGAGDDRYLVDTPDDLTFEALGGGIDTIFADINGAGYYLYPNTENLVLEGNTPFGVGNELANILTGNAIGNYLLGGFGNDTLNGKGGNDVLFGEGGADTFVFERNTKGDVIGDFQAGTDKIRLVGMGFSGFAQLQANFVENGGTTAINLGQGDFIVLNGVANSQLTAADFLFG